MLVVFEKDIEKLLVSAGSDAVVCCVPSIFALELGRSVSAFVTASCADDLLLLPNGSVDLKNVSRFLKGASLDIVFKFLSFSELSETRASITMDDVIAEKAVSVV